MSQGGVRPGAGRKSLAPDQKKVPICLSVTQAGKRMAQELRKAGLNVSEVFEFCLAAIYDQVRTGQYAMEYDPINPGTYQVKVSVKRKFG